MQSMSTLEAIHTSAKKEFSEKGFQSASLRNIVKNAKVTTGAFYGYYKSKEELFDELAGKYADNIFDMILEYKKQFSSLTVQEQIKNEETFSLSSMNNIMMYVFENRDAIKMVLLSADGTKYQNFVHDIVVAEVESTYNYFQILKQMDNRIKPISKEFIHMATSGLFSSIFEVIIHDIPTQTAIEYIQMIELFYSAGWKKIFNLD